MVHSVPVRPTVMARLHRSIFRCRAKLYEGRVERGHVPMLRRLHSARILNVFP